MRGEARGLRLLEFLRELTKFMLTIVENWRRIREQYADEWRAFNSPSEMLSAVRNLSDEEAGRILKAFMELSSIATRSKIGELEIEEMREMESALKEVIKRLSTLSKKECQIPARGG